MSKNFDNLNVNPVYAEIEEATNDTQQEAEPVKEEQRKERKTYCDLEARESMSNLRTSGKKGLKLPRINLAFSPENYDYVRTMANVRGMNVTRFINSIIDQSREENKTTYYKALEFKEEVSREMEERKKGNK